MKKIVGGTHISIKDESGMYVPSAVIPKKAEPAKEVEDISIDSLMHRAFRTIHGVIRAIEVDVGTGHPARETIMNLKDVMAMLKELKKEEKEFIDSLSDEQLVKLSKNGNSK